MAGVARGNKTSSLQQVLKYGMYFSLFFGVLTFVLDKHKRMGAAGIVLTLLGADQAALGIYVAFAAYRRY